MRGRFRRCSASIRFMGWLPNIKYFRAQQCPSQPYLKGSGISFIRLKDYIVIHFETRDTLKCDIKNPSVIWNCFKCNILLPFLSV